MGDMLLSSKKCKICFYLGNTLILITGIVVFILGIYLVTGQSRLLHQLLPEYSTRGIGTLVIIVGLCIIIACLAAFYAAARNWHCLMVALIIILVVLFFIELAAALICLFFADQDSSVVTCRLFKTLSSQYNRNVKFTCIMDQVQRTYGCCGAYDFRDYIHKIKWQTPSTSTNEILPLSCCKEMQMGCNHRSPYADRPEQLHSLYHGGCSQCLRQFVGRRLILTGYILIILFFLQWIGLIGLYAYVYHIEISVARGRICLAYCVDD